MMGKKDLFKDSSTMNLGSYLFECVTSDFVILAWYRVLFRSLPAMTHLQSMFVFGGLLFASMLLFGMVFSYDRTKWSVLFACIIPFGVYSAVTYWNVVKVRIKVLLILSIILSAAFCARIWFRRPASGSRRRILLRRTYRCLWGLSSILTAASLCLCVPMLFQRIFMGGVMLPSVGPETTFVSEEEMIEENMDTLLLLQQEKWSGLSSEEKLFVLQTVANIERNYYGLPNELLVVTGALAENTLGQYDDSSHTVCISLDSLEHSEAEECLMIVTHECYHSYEARLVDALREASKEHRKLRLFESARTYSKEYACYKDGHFDFEGYENQAVEADARARSYEAVSYYYRQIRKHL